MKHRLQNGRQRGCHSLSGALAVGVFLAAYAVVFYLILSTGARP